MLADDPGNLLFEILFGHILVRLTFLAERQADGCAHLAFLRAVSFINQECYPQLLQFRVFLNLLQHPGKLLLRGDNDGFPLLEEA